MSLLFTLLVQPENVFDRYFASVTRNVTDSNTQNKDRLSLNYIIFHHKTDVDFGLLFSSVLERAIVYLNNNE